MSVDKRAALVAIVTWMGCYEGRSGLTLDAACTMEERGEPPLTEAEWADEDFPEDMVAGYREAVRMLAAHDEQVLRRQVIASVLKENPGRTRAEVAAAYDKARTQMGREETETFSAKP